jgi:putative PIN family toxin of toxin-antitoxin system
MDQSRVVLDTNVVVSAVLKIMGPEAEIRRLVALRQLEFCVSSPILREYDQVLSRPKFSHLDQQKKAHLLSVLRDAATLFAPTRRLSAYLHEPDNRSFECAQAAFAQFLVTGNQRHFPARWKSTCIVNARGLLDAIHA